MQPDIHAKLIGGFRLWKNGQEVTQWRNRHTRALLAYLILHADRDLPRILVAEAVWEAPEDGGRSWNPERVREYLSRELCEIRRLLDWPKDVPDQPLHASRHFLRLDGRSLPSDLAQFRTLVRCSERGVSAEERIKLLQEAHRMVRIQGPLLPDLYETWAEEARYAFAAEYEAVTTSLADSARIARPSAPELLEETTWRDADAFAEYIRDMWPMMQGAERARLYRELNAHQLRTLYLAEWETRQNAVPRILVNMSVRVSWQQTRVAEQVLEMLRYNLEVRRCVPEIPRPYVQTILGSLAVPLGRYRLAKVYLERALAEFRRRRDVGCIAGTLANLSNLAHHLGDHVERLRIAEDLEITYGELGEFTVVSGFIEVQAQCRRALGDLKGALVCGQRAIDMAYRSEDSFLALDFAVSRAETLWEYGSHSEALAEVAQIRKRAEICGFGRMVYRASEAEADFRARSGEYRRSLELSAVGLEAALSLELWGDYWHLLRTLLERWLLYGGEQPRHLLDTLTRILGAEVGLRLRRNLPQVGANQVLLRQVGARLRQDLGPKGYRAAFLAGRSLSEAAIIALLRSSLR